MWSQGAGSEVMRRIAAPMIGGMVSSTLLTLIVIPVLYMLVKQWEDFSNIEIPLMGKSNFLKDNK
jgi:Cu/Ag efflux pump CusA